MPVPTLTLRSLALAACLILLLAGCGRRPSRLPAPPPPPATRDYQEDGVASWYGPPYHGRASASGEIYDMEKLTAAHRTLAFGTWVEVTCKANGKSVLVRINDRGPFIRGRIIDLSKAAARQIDMIGPGIAPVRIRVIEAPKDSNDVAWYGVQAGSFEDRARAATRASLLRDRFPDARIVERPGVPALWRVMAGRETTIDAAERLANEVRRVTGEAFVVRLSGE